MRCSRDPGGNSATKNLNAKLCGVNSLKGKKHSETYVTWKIYQMYINGDLMHIKGREEGKTAVSQLCSSTFNYIYTYCNYIHRKTYR